jgi:hypothetical protein
MRKCENLIQHYFERSFTEWHALKSLGRSIAKESIALLLVESENLASAG